MWMNRNERSGIQRARTIKQAAVFLAAACFFGNLAFLVPARAEEDPVSMEISYGYEDSAKGGRYLPVHVTVGNNQETPVKGTLEIKTRESDETVYRYDYPVEVEANGSRTSCYYIPLGTAADELVLSLVDESEAVLLNRKVKLNVSRDVPELFVGILSDAPWELHYLNGVGINYSTLRTRTFELDGSEFPEEEVGLSQFDVLVVNDYKLRELSGTQTAAIMNWVQNGGVLILGTGDRVDDTLGRFAPELLDDSYGTPNITHINLAEDFTAVNEPGAGMLAISCVDVPLHGGNVILSSNGFPLLTAAAKEQGMVAVAAFDLGDIAQFCEKQTSYVDYLFTSLLGEERINQLAEVVYSGNSSRFWAVQGLINTGDVDKLPNLWLYVGITGLYLLILGPGLYLFLRGRGLQNLYRKGVVIVALGFSGLVYVLGIPTRFRSTFYTYASIEDVTDDYVTDTTYINIRNPYNRPYTVELDPGYRLLPITRSTQYTVSGQSLDVDAPYQIAICTGEDALTVKGQNISAFTPRYFRLERRTENSEKVGITGEVDYFEGQLQGSLTNRFPYPIENATLILYGNMVQLGRMEAGETKDLAGYPLLRYPLGDSYLAAEHISGEDTYASADIRNRSYMLAVERSNLTRFYLDNYLTGYTADARVIAFSTQKEESQFLKNPSEETYGITMLTQTVPVNASRDHSIYRSVLMKVPRVNGRSYDAETNSMSGAEPLTLEYQFGTDIEVESLTFESVSEEFIDTGSGSISHIFTGSIYFYNYATGNFDRMELEGTTLNVEQLKPYLSPGNTLTVRYAYNGSGLDAIQLPMPMVAGRER